MRFTERAPLGHQEPGVGQQHQARLTSAVLARAPGPSPGWVAGSASGTGAEGVGLRRASSCFFSQ